MDIESNLVEEDNQECTSDLFEINTWHLPNVKGFITMAKSDKYTFILTKGEGIYRWEISNQESLRNAYSLPLNEKDPNKTDYSDAKVFCDSSGNHCFINIEQRLFYFNNEKNKIKELQEPKKQNIKKINSIAFDEVNSEPKSTQDILFSDNTGKIYQYRIDYDNGGKLNETLNEVISLGVDNEIYGLYFCVRRKKTSEKYIIAVSKTKLYQFIGTGEFREIFRRYTLDTKQLENSYKIFPSKEMKKFPKSMLHVLIGNDSPTSFGWMTEAGFCFGEYQKTNQVNPVQNYIILPYVKILKGGKKVSNTFPLSACHSDNHVFILYSDCLTIISKITFNIIHTQYFNSEKFTQMLYDKKTNSLWLLSSKGPSQIELFREDDNLWEDYLEQGNYQKAMDFSQAVPERYKKIANLLANELFDKGDYPNASIQYSLSDAKFEDVCLRFLDKNRYDELKNYLCLFEANIDDSNLTQKFLISMWYVEILLNELSTITNKEDKDLKKGFLVSFMKEKEKFLDKDTIYQLLQHYGCVEEFLEFAEIKKDYEAIILHYINEKSIRQALVKLQQYAEICTPKKREEIIKIFTTYSHTFMKYEPEDTIELLTNPLRNLEIDPNKIISAIMNSEKQNDSKIRGYLKNLIEKGTMKEKNIHNLYLFYLTKDTSSSEELIDYLKKNLKKPERQGYSRVAKKKEVLFELDYAKKLCSQNYPALALILALMGKYSEGVKTALEKNEIGIAEFIAMNVENKEIQKNLWLDIFSASSKGVENGNDISKVIEIMKKSNILKIEDVLPRIMDNIKIEDFKKQISDCITEYETSIESLKVDIKKFNNTAESIKNDIYKVKKRAMEIQYRNCCCEICRNNIREDNIFIFPCGHMFDGPCLLRKLLEYDFLDSMKEKAAMIRKLKMEIDELEVKKNTRNERPKEKQQGFFANVFGKEKQQEEIVGISHEELKKLENANEKMNNLLSEECVLCGDYMIESTQKMFEGDPTEWIFSY